MRRLLQRMDVDRAVLAGVAARVWSVIAGPVTALLIAYRFTPEYQGFYYTFGSLLALQVFVELGLGTVIIQFASHEWSKLHFEADGSISGDKDALSRLVSLARITTRWYATGGFAVALGLGIGGYIFFSKSSGLSVDWQLPWVSLCVLSGISICFIPVWSLLEGCNQISAVYTYRFMQGVVSSAAIWVSILAGVRLWAASASVAAILVCSVIFLRSRYWVFIKALLFTEPAHSRLNWRKEILPMQWRIALSWISGYFVASLFTPVLFRYHGPVVAGQFGMTWSVIGAIGGVAGSWLNPRVPQFGMLIARKEYKKLDQIFWRTTKIFSVIALVMAVIVWICVFVLYSSGHSLSLRILPPIPTGLFLIAQVLTILSLPLSAYLRAHKKEPLIWLSLGFGVLMAFAIFVFGRRYGVSGMALSYLVLNMLAVPGVFIIWYRCRAQWHSDKKSDTGDCLKKEYFLNRIRQKGVLYCAVRGIQRVFYRGVCECTGFLLYPVFLRMNIRFVILTERAIGHLCVELDCYIKEGILGMRPAYRTILLAPKDKVANAHLLRYWRAYFRIVQSPLAIFFLQPLARNSFTGYDTYRFAFSTKGAYSPEIQKKYYGRPALLALTEEDNRRGWECLRRIGVPEGAWFVCVHCREDGYMGQVNQSLRNAHIENYRLAMDAIVKRGGWVIRMGDPSMKRLPASQCVIDYAHSDIKSGQMDVFLCGACRFFLGGHSGLYHVSNVFGVPAVIVNYGHLAGALPYGAADIGIPKLIWSEKEKRYLHFGEILRS
ncbi:MAG: TIGR04372 family glycosyltransferase, partial [Candidatus Omnitrophota bacterium]